MTIEEYGHPIEYEHPEECCEYVPHPDADLLALMSEPEPRPHETHIAMNTGRFGHSTWRAVCCCGWVGRDWLSPLRADVDATLHPVMVDVEEAP